MSWKMFQDLLWNEDSFKWACIAEESLSKTSVGAAGQCEKAPVGQDAQILDNRAEE